MELSGIVKLANDAWTRHALTTLCNFKNTEMVLNLSVFAFFRIVIPVFMHIIESV